MTQLSSLAARLDQAGPFLLGALALTGVFARGWANTAYGLLALWGMALWVRAVLDRGFPRPALPPARWAVGLAAFALTWLVAALAGDRPDEGLKTLVVRLCYPLLLPLLAWPAFSRRPELLSRLPFLWGLGLMVAAVLTFREAGYQLICLRAKAHLGVINLGSTLGQLIPVMTAALLKGLSSGRRRETAFFALALAAAGLAMNQNCSRQTFLAAPALSLLMFWVYRRNFQKPRRLLLALALALAVLLLPLAGGGGARFLATLKTGAGSLTLNASDSLRVGLWNQGWDTFRANTWLGQGPGNGFRAVMVNRPDKSEATVSHTHHMFLDVLAKTGLLGFAGFLALYLAPLSLLWPHRRSRDPETFFWVWAALAVNLQWLLNGLTDQVFGLKTMMYIHWTVTAAALWQIRKEPGGSGP